jgi:hypothetical protein
MLAVILLDKFWKETFLVRCLFKENPMKNVACDPVPALPPHPAALTTEELRALAETFDPAQLQFPRRLHGPQARRKRQECGATHDNAPLSLVAADHQLKGGVE